MWEFPLADGLVLVRPELPHFYILNPSAATAWQLMRSGLSISQAVDRFAFLYSVPVGMAERDLDAAWSEWRQTILAPIFTAHPSTSPPSPAAPDDPGEFSRIYRLNGKNIRVVLHDPDLVDEIVPRLGPLRPSASTRADATIHVTACVDGYRIVSGAKSTPTEAYPASARVVFLQELVRVANADRDWAVILHAGACGSESKCVIFPAATHSGKTTLAAVLMHQGLTLYADDSVALERETLSIPAMPFALMLRDGSWPVLSPRFPEIEHLPVHDRYDQNVKFLHPTSPAHAAKASAAAIVFSQWKPGAATTISSLDSLAALMRLKESGFWVAHDRENIRTFLDWIQSLPIYEMVYSDLDEASTFIRSLLLN